jgi:hypothetical protein
MTASASELTFLRGAKNAANSRILPGSGKHHVNYHIEQYRAIDADTVANMHEIMKFYPSMFEVGAKASLSAPYSLICKASAYVTSPTLAVTVRTSDSEADCSDPTNSPAGTFRFLGEYSESSDDEFGYSVASGDLNGDGFDDLIVGARNFDKGTNSNLGAVYVFYGGASFAGKDLSNGGTADASFYGSSAGDEFGCSVESGDVNRDGFNDLIVGACKNDQNSDADSDAGAAYIFYGSSALAGKDLSNGGTADATFYGAAAGDEFGNSIASVDVNGDGFDDLIVGAFQSDYNSEDDSNAGAVYVYYGRADLKDQDLSDGDMEDATFYGSSENNHFGNSIASGDVNGDGFLDIIVGAFFNDAGAAYVFYGGASFAGKDLSDSSITADVSFYGKKEGDYFGISVAAGDVNGDGETDLIVGAQYNDDSVNAANAGAAYVFYGGASFAGKDLSDSSITADATFYGKGGSDFFGSSISSGDVNGDGFADLIVGADHNDDAANAANAGAAYVFYGGASFAGKDLSASGVTADASFYRKSAADYMGVCVASSDLNGDGVADLIIGAHGNDDVSGAGTDAGAAYVILGKSGLDNIDFSA